MEPDQYFHWDLWSRTSPFIEISGAGPVFSLGSMEPDQSFHWDLWSWTSTFIGISGAGPRQYIYIYIAVSRTSPFIGTSGAGPVLSLGSLELDQYFHWDFWSRTTAIYIYIYIYCRDQSFHWDLRSWTNPFFGISGAGPVLSLRSLELDQSFFLGSLEPDQSFHWDLSTFKYLGIPNIQF